MVEQTRVAKMKGRPDAYIFVTVDLAAGQIKRTSTEFSEADIREQLQRQGLSQAEIDAAIGNAQTHEA